MAILRKEDSTQNREMLLTSTKAIRRVPKAGKKYRFLG